MDSLIQKIRQELGLTDSESLTLNEVSVCLQILARDETTLKHASTEDLRALCLNRSATFSFLKGPKVTFSDNYLTQVGESLNEILLNRELPLPCLRVSPQPLTQVQIEERYKHSFCLGIVFTAEMTSFQDILHSIQNDAYVYSSGDNRIEAMGIRESWLIEKEGSLWTQRALILDNTGLVLDQIFESPVKLNAGWILHLKREQEIQSHQRISQQFQKNKIPLVNPFGKAVEKADSKYQSYLCWKNQLIQPKSCFIQKEMESNKLRETTSDMNDIRSAYLLPNTGTEGIGIHPIQWNETSLMTISQAAMNEDFILRESRGNVYYLDPEEATSGYRSIVLRANVFFNENGCQTESGYLLVSENSQNEIASVSQGGKILTLDKCHTHLYWKDESRQYQPLKITNSDLDNVGKTASRGIELLNGTSTPGEQLLFAGIDILLEYHRDKGIIPVILEANPRPSGLPHAREWIADPPRDLLVSKFLFESIYNYKN